MKKILLLCGLALFLSSGIAYTAIAPVTVVLAQEDFPSTREGWAKRYEEDAEKCKQEAYDLHREIQEVRGMVAETNGEPMFVWRLSTLKEEYQRACGWYHFHLKQAQWEREGFPTPTPTPTPTPIPPDPPSDPQRKPTPPSSRTGEMPGWPRDDTNDAHIRFVKEQERKLRELRDEKNKLFKEISDYLKKARSAKPTQPKPGFKVGFDSTSGVLIVNFTTPQGVVRVYLPADMRAGDPISGTVVAEPNGQTEEERSRNRNALTGYQLMIANQKVSEPWGTFTWRMAGSSPNVSKVDTTSNSMILQTIGLHEGASGKEVASTTIPVSKSGKTTRPQTATPDDFNLPTIGQNGSSVEIKGPFDGSLRTTEIRVGNQPVLKRTETPRSCTFQSPEEQFGPADITVKENNVEARGTYRSLGVRLNAPKTSLLKGESTTVTIDVSGLEGIKEDMPLHLEARGVINMALGNYQYLQIRPQDVKPDGRYTTTRAITGQQAGGFGVSATVIDPPRRPIIIPLTENAKVNGFRVKKEGDKFVIYVENAQNPITGKPVDGEHKLEHQCAELSKVPYISRLFLNKGSGRSTANCLMIMITPTIIIKEEE